MKPVKLAVNRPRFQPEFAPDSSEEEVEEMPRSRGWKIQPSYRYVFLTAAVTIFWIAMVYVILP